MDNFYAHETAIGDKVVSIQNGTKTWHFSHIVSNCKTGENSIVGQNVVVYPGVVSGNNVKNQNKKVI